MRSRQERLERLVCAEHCRYFKPWNSDEARCAAFSLLLDRVRGAEETLDRLERLRGVPVGRSGADEPTLRRAVCSRCGYYPEGCAYRKSAGSAAAVPCGGLRVLAELLDRGELPPEGLYGPLRTLDAAETATCPPSSEK